MRCHPYNVRYESCATCPTLGRCAVHASLSPIQKNQYLEFLLDQIHKHPDKYALGVIFMANPKPKNDILILDKDGKCVSQTSLDELRRRPERELLELKDSTIVQASKLHQVAFKIELKAQPLPDNIFAKPAKSGRKKEPALG